MRLLRILVPGLGLLFLGYLIGRLGPGEIWRNLVVLKGTFPLVLLVALSWHLTNSAAWAFAFPPGPFRPRFHSLFMAKLAGDAVSQLTPLANLGGEPLKAYLLKSQAPTSAGLASVVVNKAAQLITGLAFTALGLGLVVFYWTLPLALPVTVQAGLAILLLLAILLALVLWRQQRRLFSSLLGLLSRLGMRTDQFERRLAKATRIDENIASFYRNCRGRFLLVLGFHSAGWLLGAWETHVILRALGVHADFSVSFLITALTVMINSLFFFMPSNIGVLEGGQVFLLTALALDPATGLSLGIVKRMRKLFWILVGWLCLTHLSHAALQTEAGVVRETLARRRTGGG